MKNNQQQSNQNMSWQVGERVIHSSFGAGEIIHIFGSGNQVTLAVKFPGIGSKMLDPISKFGRLEKIR